MSDGDLGTDLHAAFGHVEPWLGWLVVALCRQRARQSWLDHVHRVHLGGARSEDGEVPGLPGWRFDYHGIGLCLIGPDGELLDVDFHDRGVDVIDPYFFATRLQSLRPAPLPEARVLRWLPNGDVLREALATLVASGHLTHHHGHGVILSHALHRVHAQVAALRFEKPRVARAWAERLGDAAPWGGDPAPAIESHRAWLRARLDGPELRAGTIAVAATALVREEAVPALERLVARGITPVTADAVDALARLRAGGPATEALLARFDPERDHPRVAVSAVSLLRCPRSSAACAPARRWSSPSWSRCWSGSIRRGLAAC